MDLNYKTQAVKRLEAFFEANYQKMYGVVLKEVGEQAAWDVVNNTYVSLMSKERSGRGHYDEMYGSNYSTYVFGELYGVLKATRKASKEIVESALQGITSEGELAPSYLESIGVCDDIDDMLLSTVAPIDICSDLLDVCSKSNTDIVALVRAIKYPDDLSSSFLYRFFASLRRAASSDMSIVSTVEDFIELYSRNPQEIDDCLNQLGVCV